MTIVMRRLPWARGKSQQPRLHLVHLSRYMMGHVRTHPGAQHIPSGGNIFTIFGCHVSCFDSCAPNVGVNHREGKTRRRSTSATCHFFIFYLPVGEFRGRKRCFRTLSQVPAQSYCDLKYSVQSRRGTLKVKEVIVRRLSW